MVHAQWALPKTTRRAVLEEPHKGRPLLWCGDGPVTPPAHFYIWITVQSKLQLESPLEQLTHHGGFIIEWSVLRMSAILAACYGNLRRVGRTHGRYDKQCRLCWLRRLRSGCRQRSHCIQIISDHSTQLVMWNGACWSRLKTLKTQTHSDGWRPGHRKYILHKAVLWSLLRMVCTYSVSRVCWILWN